MIDKSSHFREFSERQQENSSCGYWAIFNGVMMILAGDANFFRGQFKTTMMVGLEGQKQREGRINSESLIREL